MSEPKIPSLEGIDFIEYTSHEPEKLEELFSQLGFRLRARHRDKDVLLYQQGDCRFVINRQKDSFASAFLKARGGCPCIPSVGFRINGKKGKRGADKALEKLTAIGAKAVEKDPYSHSFQGIYGVGNSLIYLVDNYKGEDSHWQRGFTFEEHKGRPVGAPAADSSGLLRIDHLTHNVPVGEMNHWCEFYHQLFGFTERRYFDIKGLKTGLISKVMKSPCDSISIPINEPAEGERGKKSQIQEYLEEYRGAGIQHIALLAKDIISQVKRLRKRGLKFLKTPASYYELLEDRGLDMKEQLKDLAENHILADGKGGAYLLQIFTENLIGPIFFEVIERQGHDGFGEGNFQALFDAIEREQIKRGYLDTKS